MRSQRLIFIGNIVWWDFAIKSALDLNVGSTDYQCYNFETWYKNFTPASFITCMIIGYLTYRTVLR